MLPPMEESFIFLFLIFRGKTSRKTRIGIPISLISFPLTPLKVTGPVPVPSPIDPIPEPKSVPKPNSSPTKSAKNRMTGKVYSSKKATVPRLIQVQEPEPVSGNEVIVSPLPLQIGSELPIVIGKGMRQCTKHPLYPLSYVVSFKKLSWSYESFLTNLNNIHIPTTLSEALSNENWKQTMNSEIKALEKN